MVSDFLTSKEVLERSGISRATLNNYIARGFLPKPVVSRPESTESGGPRQIGHFYPEVLERIALIQQWKKGGMAMDDIGLKLSKGGGAPAREATGGSEVQRNANEFAPRSGNVVRLESAGEPVTLTLEDMPHAAYMVNYKFEVQWFNAKAKADLFGLFDHMPPGTEERSLFKLLLRRDETQAQNTRAMLDMNMALAKGRMALEGILQPLRGMPSSRLRALEDIYHAAQAERAGPYGELPMRLYPRGDVAVDYRAYATYFREGILIVLSEQTSQAEELLRLLGRRDMVIRTLLSKRLPVLTDLAVLVADLQESVKICSELPPDEYFELVNKIWATAGEIFRRYYGTYGKHVGDGMVYYFFPQPDSDHVMNAATCAHELKAAMGRLSKEWQLRKNWTNELYLNTGLNEGQEWLGTFQTSTSVEFVVLGETINHTARLSDMARFGQVWATKNFMSKLPPEQRERIDFGIERVGANGNRMLVQSSYSRVANLVDVESGRYVKLQDIAGLAVTEIRNIRAEGTRPA
jgi:class 3 adenylate cyclase/DNA-binding transcriptional MerR regulator